MGFAFNPFTGNFDQKGSGGGGGGSAFFTGEVATYADLPLDGTAPLDSRWLVRTNSGTWPFSSYKQAGVYVRIATVGSSRDNDYRLTDTSFFDVMSDSAFLLYDDADATKNLKFQLSGISTGTTRTLTVPNASGTVALTSDLGQWAALSDGDALRSENLTISDGEDPNYIQFTAGAGVVFNGNRASQFRTALGLGTFATADAATPPAIGNTTPSTGAFTTLSSNVGTITASTPLDVTQTWNNSATAFRAIETNITNTASQTESYHLSCRVGGSLVAYIRRDGRIVGGANVYGGTGLESALLPQGIAVGSAAFLGLCSNTFANESGCDTRLFRDAADTLAQRRSTNAQTFRLYNTFTSATNFERLNVRWASNELIIDAEKGSVGGTLRGIKIGSASTSLLGFFGATPVVQQAAIADATDAATTQARLNDLLATMRAFGLIAI